MSNEARCEQPDCVGPHDYLVPTHDPKAYVHCPGPGTEPTCEHRKAQPRCAQNSFSPPNCSICGKPMALWSSGPLHGCPQGITTWGCPDKCPVSIPQLRCEHGETKGPWIGEYDKMCLNCGHVEQPHTMRHCRSCGSKWCPGPVAAPQPEHFLDVVREADETDCMHDANFQPEPDCKHPFPYRDDGGQCTVCGRSAVLLAQPDPEARIKITGATLEEAQAMWASLRRLHAQEPEDALADEDLDWAIAASVDDIARLHATLRAVSQPTPEQIEALRQTTPKPYAFDFKHVDGWNEALDAVLALYGNSEDDDGDGGPGVYMRESMG